MADRSATRPIYWHTMPPDATIAELRTDSDRGLSGDEARQRLQHYGANAIRSGGTVPWWRILLRQFTDPLIYILLAAAAVTLLLEEYVDAVVILAVVIVNGAVGFVQEFRARKAILALAEMSAPKARVVRDGTEREIESDDLVPGDVILLAAGDRVPADARLVEIQDMDIDESALTGESAPVSKQTEPVEEEGAVPGDQYSIAFSGTSVTRGQGRGIVVRTGEASELGQIAEETRDIADVHAPIQRKMERLGRRIGLAVVILAVMIVIAGIALGWDLEEVVRTSVALAVAAVPEALPIVLTVTLAVGMQRMARRNAIIRSLPAVETLGSTTAIAADKTGTLTKNEMTVKAVWTGGERWNVRDNANDSDGAFEKSDGEDSGGDIGEALRLTLLAGLLSNEESEDPTELALLAAGAKGGLPADDTRAAHEQIDIIPFESAKQLMATLNDTPDGRCIFVKGSPEAVLERSSRRLGPQGDEQPLEADEIHAAADGLADEGFRVLATALKRVDIDRFDGDEPGADLVFAGLHAMEDPVRPEAMEAVRATTEAGIRVLMLTGDHARTARAIGEQLGLVDDDRRVVEGRELHELSDGELDEIIEQTNVYARVSPKHKLRLVERLKSRGHIVAVTGDGVNDAPALQAAHLGVAMGKAGTDVARQASDMVLTDDNFASITNAVEEGRIVFGNIRKVTYFLLSTAVAEVMVVLSSLFAPWPLPFLPVQILWINFVTSALQDVALALEPGEPGLLREKPRPSGGQVVNPFVLRRTVFFGLWMAFTTLGMFWWMQQRGVALELARAIAMTQLVALQFFHVFNCRSFKRSVFRMSPLGNPYVLGSVILSLLAHLAILHLPWPQRLFGTQPLSLGTWGMIVAAAFSIILVAEIDKIFVRRRA